MKIYFYKDLKLVLNLYKLLWAENASYYIVCIVVTVGYISFGGRPVTRFNSFISCIVKIVKIIGKTYRLVMNMKVAFNFMNGIMYGMLVEGCDLGAL